MTDARQTSDNARANRHRGEIEACLGGRRYRLCLTLGALAELETALGLDDLTALAARFGRGRVSARDCLVVIAAGLRGAGNDVSDGAVARLDVAGGAAGYARIVSDLLEATFAPASVSEPTSSEAPPPELPPVRPSSPGQAPLTGRRDRA